MPFCLKESGAKPFMLLPYILVSDTMISRVWAPKMIGLGYQGHSRAMISCFFVFLSQFALALVPRFFASSSLLTKLSLSGLGGCCRRLLRVHASAPAFVFFNILFIWGVYILVVREAISPLTNIVCNAELALLMIGLCSILCSDPGIVIYGSSCLNEITESTISKVKPHSEELEPSTSEYHEDPMEESSFSISRVRYCRICKAYVKGFDHHCPAFGNCIGEKNHVLFMVLLVGFIIVEASYIVCSTQFIQKFQIMDKAGWGANLSNNLAISTKLFSLLQVLWQGIFLVWHIYCVCFNITTDEWINWKKYPEFQFIVQPQPGQNFSETRFRNPYNKGVIGNMKEFLASK